LHIGNKELEHYDYYLWRAVLQEVPGSFKFDKRKPDGFKISKDKWDGIPPHPLSDQALLLIRVV
jgi:hypothetical protein